MIPQRLLLLFCLAITSARSVAQQTSDTWTGFADSLWSNPANWSSGMLPSISTNVNIPQAMPNMPVIDIPGAVANNVTVSLGATLSFTGTGNVLEAKGDIISNGHFTAINGKVILSGSGMQSIPGVNYDSLVINGGGTANLTGNTNILKALLLFSGNLQANSYDIHIARGAALLGSNTGYIVTNSSGNITIDSLDVSNSPVFVPVGSSSGYTPLQLSNLGDRDDFSVRVGDSVYANYNNDIPVGNALTGNAVAKTWFVSEAVPGGSNSIITTYWNATDELPGFNRLQSYVSHYSNTTNSWMPGSLGAANGSDPYWHTINNVTSFSPFGVASAGTPLATNQIDLSATCDGKLANIHWTVTDEKDNIGYFVERSVNARDFYRVNSVLAADGQEYFYTDNIATLQADRLYYRLQVNKIAGEEIYSSIVAVDVKHGSAGVTIFPNPVTGQELFLYINKPVDKQQMVIFDMQGKKIMTVNHRGSSQVVKVNVSELPSGLYFIKLDNENMQPEFIRFTKQ